MIGRSFVVRRVSVLAHWIYRTFVYSHSALYRVTHQRRIASVESSNSSWIVAFKCDPIKLKLFFLFNEIFFFDINFYSSWTSTIEMFDFWPFFPHSVKNFWYENWNNCSFENKKWNGESFVLSWANLSWSWRKLFKNK